MKMRKKNDSWKGNKLDDIAIKLNLITIFYCSGRKLRVFWFIFCSCFLIMGKLNNLRSVSFVYSLSLSQTGCQSLSKDVKSENAVSLMYAVSLFILTSFGSIPWLSDQVVWKYSVILCLSLLGIWWRRKKSLRSRNLVWYCDRRAYIRWMMAVTLPKTTACIKAPINMMNTEKTFSVFVLAATFPNPTDVKDEVVKYRAVMYAEATSVCPSVAFRTLYPSFWDNWCNQPRIREDEKMNGRLIRNSKAFHAFQISE